MYIIGIDPTSVYLAPASGVVPPGFGVGQLGADALGNIYRFCVADASGVTGAGYVCAIEPSNVLDMVETTNSAPGADQGMAIGISMAAIVANGFGWVAVYGSAIPMRVSASCALGTRLNTTATAGQLDDDGTASSEEITGIALQVANGGAAGNVNALVTWPYIGRTL